MAGSEPSPHPTALAHRPLGALVVFTLMASAGCTTSERSGQVYYLVACGGGSTGVPNICYARAEKLCPGGYTVLSGDPPASNEPQTMRVACRRNGAKP